MSLEVSEVVTVREAAELKREAETSILNILRRLEYETGMSVRMVIATPMTLDHTDKESVASVSVELKL